MKKTLDEDKIFNKNLMSVCFYTSMTIKSYKDLIVWQKSITLVRAIYLLTDNFPKNESYCLSIQMRKATISIPSNIAEGYGRGKTGDYLKFLRIACGSLYELETQLIIAKFLYEKQDYKNIENLILEIQKMLNSLISKLSS